MSNLTDFAMSKENIQPLSGGRNPAQLGLALQAQTDPQTEQELQDQLRECETAIANYTGPDPLGNWYSYIVLVEQSYPKHGGEGKLYEILENCLETFEHDKRYANDRRFCKLWLKFIDMLPDPLEIYQMLYAKNLCRGCSDLYRAWAYYHEMQGNYQEAFKVFECGRKEMAQPHDEFLTAHAAFLSAAGHYFLKKEPDRRRLEDCRHALFQLYTSKPGKVDSVRVPISGAGGGYLSSAPTANSNSSNNNNNNVVVYEDNNQGAPLDGLGIAAAPPPLSIISYFKRQNPPKENMIKAGVWTGASSGKRRTPCPGPQCAFTVHEDEAESSAALSPKTNRTASSSRLPRPFPPATKETYDNWHVSLTIAEPSDVHQRCYPKHEVYTNDTEYSLEEIRAVRYLARKTRMNSLRVEEEFVEQPKFTIFEQSNLAPPPAIGAIKTTPFQDLNAEELVETGSMGGMEVATIADDERDVSNMTCNTQIFNFNLNAMKVSTPQSSVHHEMAPPDSVRKQLFSNDNTTTSPEAPPPLASNRALSTIFEETKSSSSSGGGGGSSTEAVGKQLEHTSYFEQNMRANAMLRERLLANLMDPPIVIQSPRPHPVFSATPLIQTIPSNPFAPALLNQLLDKMGFPGRHTDAYRFLTVLPRLTVQRRDHMSIGTERYVIERQLGKGTFGVVFKGVCCQTGDNVALKSQKDANRWEYYICKELQRRLADHPLRHHFMDIQIGYFSAQSSIFISKFVPNGSLLNVANMVRLKTGVCMRETLCLHFCLEMLRIVEAMHSVRIIHGDIKPDNFLVGVVGGTGAGAKHTLRLQLIDFGSSIDMALFPEGAAFRRRVTTENFVCCEMLDGRPWNYHTDLFCVAATAHVLLFKEYIQMQKRNEQWSIVHHMHRYQRIDVWNTFFNALLNQQVAHHVDDNQRDLQILLETTLQEKNVEYTNDMRFLINLLNKR